MKRVLYDGETVTFQTKSNKKAISFYDKLLEMEKDKWSREALATIPDFIKEYYNILRYEIKVLKYHKSVSRLKNLTFIDLCKPEIYEYLYHILVTTFDKLSIVDFDIPANSFVSRKGWLKNFLAMIGLKSYGIPETFNLIDSQDYDVQDPVVKRSNQKKIVRDLVSQYNNLHQTSIKRELASKLGALYGILI